MRKEDENALGLRTLWWKPLKLINRMLTRPGQPLKGSSLKNRVGTTKFIYVGRMTSQPFWSVRLPLRANRIDTKKMYDIYFLRGQAGSLLTDIECADTAEKMLTAGKSTNDDPEGFRSFKPQAPKEEAFEWHSEKTPVEICTHRAVITVSMSKSLLMATKCLQALTEKRLASSKKGWTASGIKGRQNQR